MRVLFVTRKYPPRVGGMESLAYGLINGYPGDKTVIALGRSQKHLVWFLPYALLRVALTGHRYDVIYLGDALLSVVGLVPRVLFRRPLAMSVHGLDLTWPVAPYQAYLRRFLRADVFVANSESTRRLAETRGLSPVRTITIGAPEQYFRLERAPITDPELSQRRGSRKLLLTVGRLVRRKGVAWFVRNVLPQLPNALYVVVGVGPEHDAILRAAREANVSERLCLLGKVSEARLLELLGGCDVFVMPNIEVAGDVEGFGIVAIEAAASGLPVVAARLEGIPDAIADGENGQLIESGNAPAFVDALTKLTADPAELARRGEHGRDYTERRNAWPRIIARWRALFDELAAAGRPS